MTIIEETGLATRTEQSFELAPTAAAAEKQFEIQSAIVVARRFPRNEDFAFAKLMKSCHRLSFAEETAYSFKRGRTKNDKGEWVDNYVTGPSVALAREAARVWGNIRYGLEIVRDDEASRQIRGWAWDMETNTKVTAEDDFEKLIQRRAGKGADAETKWVRPDERDLRELTNRRGSILVRNCILQVLPKDLIEDALLKAEETIEKKVTEDPEGSRKRLIVAFSELNITPPMLEEKLGHPLAQCSPSEVAALRKIYKSIADGNSTWAEYSGPAGNQNGDEPRRKSDTPATATSAEATTGTAGPEVQLPIDTTRTHIVAEVHSLKKGAFEIETKDGHKLFCADQRLYITATSAKQSGAHVMLEAKLDGDLLTLTGIEEAAV